MKGYFTRAGRFTASALASATMVLTPVAQGREVQNLNKERLAQRMQSYGLNRTMTVGEFWMKIKADVPGHMYKDLEAFAKANKNMKMPEMELSSARATDGSEIPVLRITQNGKTHTLQYFGEKNKFAKLNGVTLSEADLKQPREAFARIEASDSRLKKEANAYRAKMSKMSAAQKAGSPRALQFQKDMARFAGFPRVTPVLWKSMTRQQRADYIVKMRMMWLSARKVLSLSNGPAAKAAPVKKKESALIENFYKIIFGQEAEANPPAAGPYSGDCVVAGYIGTYEPDGRTCRVNNALTSERYTQGELAFVGAASQSCQQSNGSNFVACNPVIYGYPGGNAFCVNKTDPRFQIATHFPGPCDEASRLTDDSILGQITWSTSGDYTSGQPRPAQIAAIEANQRNNDFALSKQYLEGVLRQGGKLARDADLQTIIDGAWTKQMDDELVRIQSQFEAEIQHAIGLCEASIAQNGVSAHERNQIGACDQLHRRWLFTERFIAQFRAKACDPSADYIGKYENAAESSFNPDGSASEKTALNKRQIDEQGTNLCQCKDDANRKVNFGQACGAMVPPSQPPSQPPSVTPPVNCEAQYPGATGLDAQCKCPNGQPPERDDGRWECDDDGGGFPWLLVGGAALIGACLFIFCKGGDKDKPPVLCPNGQPAPNRDVNQCPLLCPNGQPAPNRDLAQCPGTPPTCTAPLVGTPPACACGNTCPAGTTRNETTCSCDQNPPPPVCEAPKVGTPPNCACAGDASCTPPQKIYNMVTCQCENVPQPPVCADGTPAPNGNLANCPKCPDGSYRPAGGCPPPPSEGDNGQNNNGGVGGLPPQGTGN